MRTVLIPAAMLISCSMANVSRAADECKDILLIAAQDITKIDRTSFNNQKFKAWYCSSQSEKKSEGKDAGLSVGLPIGGIPAKGDGKFSQSSIVDKRSDICREDRTEFTDFETLAVLKKVVRPDVVQAWNSCIRSHSDGREIVALKFATVDRFINGTLTYNPPNQTIPEPILDQVAVSGATCSGLDVGKAVSVQGLPFLCTRDDLKIPAIIILGTSYGVKTLSLNANTEGVCKIENTYKKETWTRQPEPKIASFDTPDLNCTKGCKDHESNSGVNHEYRISVGDDERIVPDSVQPATRCERLPGHDGDGCPFTRIVDGPTYAGRTAAVTMRSWGVPIRLSFRAYAESRSFAPETRQEGSATVSGGKTFVVTGPKGAESTLVTCRLTDGNEFTFVPAETESDGYVRRISVNDTGPATKFTYELIAR